MSVTDLDINVGLTGAFVMLGIFGLPIVKVHTRPKTFRLFGDASTNDTNFETCQKVLRYTSPHGGLESIDPLLSVVIPVMYMGDGLAKSLEIFKTLDFRASVRVLG